MANSKTSWTALIGWLTAFIAPPVIAGAVWRRFASHHLGLAITAGAAYWVAVAVARFAGDVVGDLSGRWRTRLVDYLDVAFQQRASRFDRRYKAHVLASLRFIDLKGLATVGSFTPELDDVFVDVSLVPRPPHEIKPGVLGELAAGSRRRALSEFIGRPEPVVLAVVGGPGSGKTTLLRHTARQACLPGHPRRRPDRDLPLILYLRDHAAAITADSPAASLTELLRFTLGEIAAAEPPGWLEQKLRSGRCTVLLDGLDEVARQEDRAKVAAWTEKQIRTYPDNDFLITSRPHGYRTAPVEGAEVVQVCGFTTTQVNRFVRGWYLAEERHSTGSEGPDIDARARERADDLLQRLDHAPLLHDLTVNPLLLTMIANVHRYRGALPGSRAELYAEICQVMLWRRQEAKNLASEMSGEKKEAVLRALAYAMMQRRVPILGRQDIIDEVRPVLRRLSRKAALEDLLGDIESNGLLVERETGQYSFAHHTFQEYLASAYIRDKGLATVLAENVSDPWWRETTLLYAARTDADLIVKACLDAGTVTALALAFDCADQDSEIDTGLREYLDSLLAAGSSPKIDAERRRLIVGVLLTRHLRQQVTAADGTRVCTRPISTDLYRIFLADTRTPAPDAGPDAANSETATGMRGTDAAAFAMWASTIIGGGGIYRLPGFVTLEDHAVQNAVSACLPDIKQVSVWATRDGGTALGRWWHPDAPASVRGPDAATALAICLESDVARSTITQFRLLTLWSLVWTTAVAGYLHLVRQRSLSRAHELALAMHPANDLNLNLTATHPLAPALARTYDLAGTPYLSHGLGSVLARVLAITPALVSGAPTYRPHRPVPAEFASRNGPGGVMLNLASHVDRALEGALAHARACAVDLDFRHSVGYDRARNFTFDLNGVLETARLLEDVRARVADIDSFSDTGLSTALAGGFGRVLDSALDLAQDLHRTLDRILAGAFITDREDGLDPEIGDAVPVDFPVVISGPLAQALAKAIGESGPASSWPAVFTRALTAQADAGTLRYYPDADVLAGELARVEAMLKRPLSIYDVAAASWTAASEHLAQTAGPVLRREARLSPGRAAGIRLAALCLASEADSRSLNKSQLGDMLRDVAAGVTLLQLRHTGELPATETILLATD